MVYPGASHSQPTAAHGRSKKSSQETYEKFNDNPRTLHWGPTDNTRASHGQPMESPWVSDLWALHGYPMGAPWMPPPTPHELSTDIPRTPDACFIDTAPITHGLPKNNARTAYDRPMGVPWTPHRRPIGRSQKTQDQFTSVS